MLGELVPCGGGDPIPLLKPNLLIGRQELCDVRIPEMTVSSRHCELEFKDGHWFVRDVGSTNGIQVAGAPCASSWLMPGDELRIAAHRFNIQYTAEGPRPVPEPEAGSSKLSERLVEETGIEAAQDQPGSNNQKRRTLRDRALGQLLPVGGGQPIGLIKPKLTVGRHENCDIVLRFPTVSQSHCVLEFIEGYWLVRDIGSRNGVRVDGKRVKVKWLMPNCVFAVADHRYNVHYKLLSDDPPPSEGLIAMTLSQLE